MKIATMIQKETSKVMHDLQRAVVSVGATLGSAVLIFLFAACTQSNKSVEKEMFEQQLLSAMESNDLHKNALLIGKEANNEITMLVRDGWEVGGYFFYPGMDISKAELCRGRGLSFVKCVQQAVDSGKCVAIYRDGDDYVAVEVDCNRLQNG